MSSPEVAPKDRCRWASIGVVALAVVLFLSRLGAAPTTINAEERCEEVVRRMLDSGDWLLPRMGNAPRVNKPPLLYWLSCLCCKAAGGFGLTPFRLPSAIAGIGLVLLALAWGRELRAPREGVLAAALLLVTYESLVQGRRGSFEMLLAFFSGATLLAGYRAATTGRLCPALLAALGFGLAFLTKATPALLFAPLPLAAWTLARGRWRSLLAPRVWGLSLAALALGLSWHLYMGAFHPETRAIFESQLFLPFGVQAGAPPTAMHLEPWWYYLGELFRKGFLLALFLPLLAVRAWAGRSEGWRSPWSLLLLAIVLPMLVLTCLPSKQDHYYLPALLPLALAAARGMTWAADEARALSLLRVPAALCLVASLLGGLLAAKFLDIVGIAPPFACWAAGGAIIALACASLAGIAGGRWRSAAATGFLSAALVWLAYFTEVRPLVDAFESKKIYAEASYDAAAWDARFREYPLLTDLLHVHPAPPPPPPKRRR